MFQVDVNCELFVGTLQHYRGKGEYRLHGFVVMPDHFHLLITPKETLERAMSLVKGGFSHRMGSKMAVWQRGYTDHRVRDKQDYLALLGYIHENPVRAGICAMAGEFRWSSAWRGGGSSEGDDRADG